MHETVATSFREARRALVGERAPQPGSPPANALLVRYAAALLLVAGLLLLPTLALSQTGQSTAVYVDASGNVGIGTTTPEGTLELHGAGPVLRMTDTSSSTTWNLRVDSSTGRLVFFSPGGGAATGSFKFDPQAQENLLRVGTTAADEVSISGNLIISGTCSSEQVDCAADYVFDPDYPLPTLAELKAYVTENRRLPGMPGADDFYSSGINLREMNYALLEKVEELVLYTIQQHEAIEELQRVVASLAERFAGLESAPRKPQE